MTIFNNIPVKNIRFLAFVMLIFSGVSCATLTQETDYPAMLKEIRYENADFSFVKLRDYLREHPGSRHRPEIMFAMGEYYFQIKNYHDAVEELARYINEYPEDKNAVFAQAILYKILLEYTDEPQLLEKLKEDFFCAPLFFVFSDAKTKYYKSILNNSYKIIDYVDRIEVFKNEESFLKITP